MILVTEETFLKWKKSFFSQENATMSKSPQSTQRPTGRQLFERHSIGQQIDSTDCLAEDEEGNLHF